MEHRGDDTAAAGGKASFASGASQRGTEDSALEITDLMAVANADSAVKEMNANQVGTSTTVDAGKDEAGYMAKCFEIMHKYKNVCELVVAKYVPSDEHFKYQNVLNDLETDLATLKSLDEAKYNQLCESINTDIVLAEDDQDQLDSGETTMVDDLESEQEEEQGAETNVKDVEVVPATAYNPPKPIARLDGQTTAEAPKCPACDHTARCRNKLEAHILEHSDNPMVMCIHDGCRKLYPLHEMFKHEEFVHPKLALICVLCNEAFEEQSILAEHLKLHIKRKDKLMCDRCDYTDIYAGRMDKHKESVHGLVVLKDFPCPVEGCGRLFTDRKLLHAHSRTHAAQNLHTCTEGCGKLFKYRHNMLKHVRKSCKLKQTSSTTAKDPAIYKFSCDICGSRFKRNGHMVRHRETHSAERNRFKCTVDGCTKVYLNKGDRTRHIKRDHYKATMDNESELSEDEPSELSASEEDADSRQGNEEDDQLELMNSGADEMILGDETIKECELCSIKFDSSKDLIAHFKQTHHPKQYTVKPIRCTLDGCHFATHYYALLTKHQNTEHGGKYKCEVCGHQSKDATHHHHHQKTHIDAAYVCREKDCGSVHKCHNAYRAHVLMHSNEQPIYRCDYQDCTFTTYTSTKLQRHQVAHSDVRNFSCPYEDCEETYKYQEGLTQHLTYYHKGNERPKRKVPDYPATVNFACSWPKCNFKSTDQTAWRLHRAEHLADAEDDEEKYDPNGGEGRRKTATGMEKNQLKKRKKAAVTEDDDEEEEAFAKKPTKKTKMIASDSESADSNIQTVASTSRRSVRKRKLVNYKEPSTVEDDDADSDDMYEKSSKKTNKKAKF